MEVGPEADDATLAAFAKDVALLAGEDAFATKSDRETFSRAFEKQIVFNKGEVVFYEMQTMDEEARESKGEGYFVYFVIRGALAATKLVHPRYATVHTPEALKHVEHALSILRPIRMQTPIVYQDTQADTEADRLRAKDMRTADESQTVELAKFIRGSFFGDYEVLEGHIPRQYTITTLVNNTAVAVMPASVFESFTPKGSELRRRIEADRSTSSMGLF